MPPKGRERETELDIHKGARFLEPISPPRFPSAYHLLHDDFVRNQTSVNLKGLKDARNFAPKNIQGGSQLGVKKLPDKTRPGVSQEILSHPISEGSYEVTRWYQSFLPETKSTFPMAKKHPTFRCWICFFFRWKILIFVV